MFKDLDILVPHLENIKKVLDESFSLGSFRWQTGEGPRRREFHVICTQGCGLEPTAPLLPWAHSFFLSKATWPVDANLLVSQARLGLGVCLLPL